MLERERPNTFLVLYIQASEFEGGYRVASFVSGGVLPPAVRGSIQVLWCLR